MDPLLVSVPLLTKLLSLAGFRTIRLETMVGVAGSGVMGIMASTAGAI